jgi:DUF177 domain-containing protein
MTTIDLRSLRLRPGEVRQERIVVALDPFVLGGQRYEVATDEVPADLEIAEVSGGAVFRLALETALSGPCMRCLGHAEVDLQVGAREFHDSSAPARDDRRSDYVSDDRLDVSAWARDLIALGLPDQILCRPECAGLCPVCGRDLNVEPHEHVEHEPDPRWAALQSLREEL